MATVFDDNIFSDDLFEGAAQCDPITQAELDDADSFDTLADSTAIKLLAPIEEDRRGDARTTKEQTVAGDGPVVFSSKVFSMHRLLWADGVMVDKTTAALTKATFAVFRVNLDSHTMSSGAGRNRAIQSARIQVEFHGTGPDANKVGAQRPVVVGWAPFATAEKSNKTTAERTRTRSMRAGLEAGATLAKGTAEGTASSTRSWSQSYFDVNRSRPVSVVDRNGESSDYNGVRWEMEHNHLAGEGVKPEVLLYLLVTRQDDREYAVRITAEVDTARFLGCKEHKCVLRVTPKNPDVKEPAVCYLQGRKMWQRLDVGRLEALLSPAMDSSLKLPWDLEEMTGSEDAESGAVVVGEDGGNEATHDEDGSQENRNGNEGAAETEPSTTLTAAVSLAEERPESSVEGGQAARSAKRKDATTPLDDPAAILDALLEMSGNNGQIKEDDLPTRMAMLESRMELMEYRMARQALLIRALLRQRGQ